MILVFGTVCLDRVRRVPALPPPGGYIEVVSEKLLLGGEAANTANALNQWGDSPVLAGNPLGTSTESAYLKKLLAERGLESVDLLDTNALADRLVTPVCDIYVTDNGERTMFGRGFSELENSSTLDRIGWEKGGWFTAEPNMERLSREAISRAHQEGMHLYLMDFIRPDDPIFEGCYWQSSTDWVGSRNNTHENLNWVKRWVEAKGCMTILSDGPNGFAAGSPSMEARWYPPFPAPQVTDTTGAGDMFRAGMLHGLSRSWALRDCLRFASAAGCLKCRTLGATTAVPSIEEIETHLRDHPEVARLYD